MANFNPFFRKSTYDVDGNGSLANEAIGASGSIAGFAGNTIAGFSWRPYQPQIPDSTLVDPTTDRPVYNLGTQSEGIDAINSSMPRGTIFGSAASGATAGSSFGPAGALVGGAVGAITGLFTRRKQKKKARRARRRFLQDFEMAQDRFNERDINASMVNEAKIRSDNMRRNQFNFPTSLI